jgi:hypothetical protein
LARNGTICGDRAGVVTKHGGQVGHDADKGTVYTAGPVVTVGAEALMRILPSKTEMASVPPPWVNPLYVKLFSGCLSPGVRVEKPELPSSLVVSSSR